jgi:hypothetical protein
MNRTRTKERRFVYIQCKVPTGWRSLKFRDAGGTGSRHPSSLGARTRPCVPAHDIVAVRGRGAGYGSQTARKLIHSVEGCGVRAHARAWELSARGSPPDRTRPGENKM